jgi:hypothetical protein
MMQMFIEGQEVDINEVFSTMLTSSIDDVKTFGTKESSFSKTIILPGTKKNNKLFGNIFNTKTRSEYNPLLPNFGYNFNPAVSAKVVIFNGNIQQIKGTIRLLQINVVNNLMDYEVAIVGEMGGFAAKMGNKKVTDLDFSAYDHTYSIATITGSWANEAAGAGYVYPLIDFGTYSVLKDDWKVGTFRPAIFLKEVIEKIVTNAGYTMDFPLLATDRLKRCAIPYNRKTLTASNTSILNAATTVYPSLTTIFASSEGLVEVRLRKNGVDVGSAFYSSLGINTLSATINIAPSDTIDVLLQSGSLEFTGIISIGAFTTLDNIVYIYAGATTISTTVSVTITLYNTSVSSSGSINPDEELLFDARLGVLSSLAIATPVLLGDAVKMNDALPTNILQKDVFSNILKLFNLYVTEDKFKEKHLVITPFPDFFTGSTAEDWSNKVDRSQPIVIKPMSELNARYYSFNYKDDSDFWNDLYKKRYNETYGSRIYDSEFEFAKETAKVELIFSPTVLVGYSGQDKIFSTIFKSSNGNEERIDSNIRLLLLRKITGVASWKVKSADGLTDLSTQTEYLYAGHLSHPTVPVTDLNFGATKELFLTVTGGTLNVNQFNVYYSTYMAEITDKDSKLLSCTLKLSSMDYYNLAFNKYKWIDGSLWRLNKIIDFNATREDTCKAEFIKLINTNY